MSKKTKGIIIIEIELDLSDTLAETGITLTQHETSLFEYFAEKTLEDYNPARIIEQLELEPNSNLAKIFKQGFDIHATLQ